MPRSMLAPTVLLVALLGACTSSGGHRAPQGLASWNDTAAAREIVGFVERVTDGASPEFVPPAERIAVFDNDGTLWSEQPMYVQLAYVLDRVRAMASDHPEWREEEPFRSVLAGDPAAVAASGNEGLMKLVAATHAGRTTEEFEREVVRWLDQARHPRTGRPYTEMVYRPMVELVGYLQDHGFRVFIVSGGGIEFMRPWTAATYGIPPEQVVGSSLKVEYEVRDGEPVLVKLPELDFMDDGPGKPVGIHRHIGRRPILAAGNSDGDFEMLEYTTAGSGPRLGLIVHHDDAEREVAYDRESSVGHLERALDEAPGRGWLVVSMRRDWRTVLGARSVEPAPTLLGGRGH